MDGLTNSGGGRTGRLRFAAHSDFPSAFAASHTRCNRSQPRHRARRFRLHSKRLAALLVLGIVLGCGSDPTGSGGGGNGADGLPAITSIDPDTLAFDQQSVTLSLQGRNFTDGSVATWEGSTRPTSFVSSTELSMSLETEDTGVGGFFQVAVRNDTISGPFTVTVTNPDPTILRYDPDRIAVGSESMEIEVASPGFLPGTTLFLDGQAIATRFVDLGRSNHRLFGTVPDDLLASEGDLTLSLRTPDPTAGTFDLGGISVFVPLPEIDSVTPSELPVTGTEVELTVFGSGFAPVSRVFIDGIEAQSQFLNTTTFRATLPVVATERPGERLVAVYTPGLVGGGVFQPGRSESRYRK